MALVSVVLEEQHHSFIKTESGLPTTDIRKTDKINTLFYKGGQDLIVCHAHQ